MVVNNKVTLKDVAGQAGVHMSTASRALNPRTRSVVNPRTVERVLSAAENLDYHPHPLARGLRTNRTMTVGMVIPDIENPLFGPIIAGAEEVLGAEGYSLLLANTEPSEAADTSVVETLAERRVDGMILSTAVRDDADVRHLVERGIPVVLANRSVENMRVPSVIGNDHTGVGLAMRHLVELGHRRIGHVAGPQILSTGLGRYRAFLDWVEVFDVDEAPVEFADWFRMEPGYRSTVRLLDNHPDLTAIVAGNDLLALGAYRAVREAGHTVGEGISITGYNDVPFMELMQPPMTAVRIPYRRMGSEAARLLLRLLGDGELLDDDLRIELKPTLAVRASTAAPRV